MNELRKCEKCGKPILGTSCYCIYKNDLSKKYADDIIDDVPEIIEFDELVEEPEIIGDIEIKNVDIALSADEISVSSDTSSAASVNDENPSLENTSKIVTPIMAAPVPEATQKIQIKEIQEAAKKEMSNDVPTAIPVDPVNKIISSVPLPVANEDKITSVSEPTPIVVTSPSVKESEEIEEVVTPELNDDKTVVSGKVNFPLIVITILFIISLLFNIYYIINNVNPSSSEDDKTISDTTKLAYFGNYKIELPTDWNTITSKDNTNIILSDSTEQWAVSINVVANASASLVQSNADQISSAFGDNKYLFTNYYQKTYNNKDYYIFKGKYYNYATYVITLGLNGSNTIVADLKFKGAVDEDVTERVLDVMGTLTNTNLSKFYSNNFEFNDISSIISNNITLTETK